MPSPINEARTRRRGAIKTMFAGVAGTTLLNSFDVPLELLAAADGNPAGQTVLATGTDMRRAVATVHPMATQAAVSALDRGGNAFDAAIAAAFMLGVVDGHNSGMGGGCFILARTAAGQLIAIDGRETAPGLAHRDMFLRDGAVDPVASQVGPLASGVPGQVAALWALSSQHGRIGWKPGLNGAARVAAEGYSIGAATVSALNRESSRLRLFPASQSLLLKSDGSPRSVGETLRQPELAHSLTAIADEGPDWFYRGPFASACDRWMRKHGGLLRASDFANYTAKARQPLSTQYRQWQVVGFPPPSSGGIHIAQMLMMLERFDVRALYQNEPAIAVHLLAEVMKRAFADRAHWLGDADFVGVPNGLIDRQYCEALGANIDLKRATSVGSHGQPPRASEDLFSRQHTTHLTTADAEGNWVAITNTVNTTFGSCVVIPGTGIMMNNQMDDFSISPGTPNAFGLIGAAANSIAAGKRPLSSMSPTIVLDDRGVPQFTCGAAGGPRIINAVLQCLIGVLDREMSVEEALAAPRVHHQWSPDRLMMEPQWDASVVEAIQKYGHVLAPPSHVAIAQAIHRAQSGGLTAASDPRLSRDGATVPRS